MNLKEKIFGVSKIFFEGFNIEKLLNKIAKENIKIVELKREGKRVELTVPYKSTEAIVAILTELCYNITQIEKEGGFPAIAKLKKFPGIIVGIILFFAIIFLSGSFLYRVDIECESQSDKVYIESFLKDMGVSRYTFAKNVDVPDIEKKLLKSGDRFSFVSCHLNGSVLTVKAVSSNFAKAKDTHPADLIATKRGIVDNIVVISGTAKVKVGDYVEIGQVLIAGYVSNPKTDKTALIKADGKVSLISTETYKFSHNESKLVLKRTGNKAIKKEIALGKALIPISDNLSFTFYESESKTYDFINGDIIPIKVVETIYYELEYVFEEHKLEDELNSIKSILKMEANDNLGKYGKIISEKFEIESNFGISVITLNIEKMDIIDGG